jgi:hypothetical protein
MYLRGAVGEAWDNAYATRSRQMTADRSEEWKQLSYEERRARIVGNSLENDEEDIRFWREASEALRARTLFRLLYLGKAMYKVTPHIIEEQNDSVRMVLRPHRVEIVTGYE